MNISPPLDVLDLGEKERYFIVHCCTVHVVP